MARISRARSRQLGCWAFVSMMPIYLTLTRAAVMAITDETIVFQVLRASSDAHRLLGPSDGPSNSTVTMTSACVLAGCGPYPVTCALILIAIAFPHDVAECAKRKRGAALSTLRYSHVLVEATPELRPSRPRASVHSHGSVCGLRGVGERPPAQRLRA
jgi:hypothetical protein